MKLLKLIFIIFLSLFFGCALKEEKPYKVNIFSVDDVDDTIISFYYPDTVIQSKNYKNMLFDLIDLDQIDLDRYFKYLQANEYSACKNFLDKLIAHSEEKGFAALLKFRLYMHSIEFCMKKRSQINASDKKMHEEASNVLLVARSNGIDWELIRKLNTGTKLVFPNYEKSEKRKLSRCYEWVNQ